MSDAEWMRQPHPALSRLLVLRKMRLVGPILTLAQSTQMLGMSLLIHFASDVASSHVSRSDTEIVCVCICRQVTLVERGIFLSVCS